MRPRARPEGRRRGARRFARSAAGGLSSRLPPRTLRQTTDTVPLSGKAAPPPDRPPRRVVGNSCFVRSRSAAPLSFQARGFAMRHRSGVADGHRGDAPSRPDPIRFDAHPRHATPPPRPARGLPMRVIPASRCSDRHGPRVSGPGIRRCGTSPELPTRTHGTHELEAEVEAEAGGDVARGTFPARRAPRRCRTLPLDPPGCLRTRAVGGSGRLSRRGRPAGRSRDRPVDRRGPTTPPRRAARRGAAPLPARPVGRGRRCGRCGRASRRARPPSAT